MQLRWFAVGLFTLVSQPAFAQEKECSEAKMLGAWQCVGSACSHGADTSHVRHDPDDTYWWIDGGGTKLSLTVSGKSVRRTNPDGTPNNGQFVDEQCTNIRWDADGHHDQKM